jgi:heme exporter protein B
MISQSFIKKITLKYHHEGFLKKSFSWLLSFLFINKISLRSLWVKKASWFGTFMFGNCLLILFPFAFGTEVLKRNDIQMGTYWMMNEFISVLSLNRIFSAEQESSGLDYLLASTTPRFCIIAGKISFTAIQILSLQIPLTFFWILWYNVSSITLLNFLSILFPLILVFNCGTASLGTLIACLTARSAAKEILQPMLFFPLQSGILLAAVTLSLHAGGGDLLLTSAFNPQAWWTLLITYPIIFTVLCFLFSKVLLQE